MDIETIEKKINFLEELYSNLNDIPERLTDKIILAYAQKVIKDLQIIITNDGHNEEVLSNNIRLFLKDNWDFVKENLLSYTALPKNEITDLLCDAAEYVSDIKKGSFMECLMPTVVFRDSLSPEQHPHLDLLDASAFRRVLQTHILSVDRHFLIPVSLLTQDNITSLVTFDNVYYDVQDPRSPLYLIPEELKRLFHHSDETRAVRNARSQYKILSENKDTLLGQLNTLNNKLLYNSKVGVGEEKEAGNGVYPAILDFSEYWPQLTQDVRDNLPSVLLEQIKLILGLASPEPEKEKNIKRNYVDLIDTCLATRRSHLQKEIIGHEVQCLSLEQCKAVCASLKEQLPLIIKSTSDFISVLFVLAPKQCEAVCEESLIGFASLSRCPPCLIAGGGHYKASFFFRLTEPNVTDHIDRSFANEIK